MKHDFWAEQDGNEGLFIALTAKDKRPFWREWQRRYVRVSDSDLPAKLNLIPDLPDVANFPLLSWAVKIPIRLKKPFLGKDEQVFYPLDNPIRKEKVFQNPMMAATGWKGALRSAMVYQLAHWWGDLDESDKNDRKNRKSFVANRIRISRLFGTERGVLIEDDKCEVFLDQIGGRHQALWYREYVKRCASPTGSFAGRLYFFPTFFDQIDLEVINPHNRETDVGDRGPILMECVPVGATGSFMLLSIPFDRIGKDKEETRRQIAEDLKLLAEGVEAMLTIYGFGAKTSSGFGVGDVQGQGQLLIHYPDSGKAMVKPASPVEPSVVSNFISEYSEEDFKLKPNEWRKTRNASKRKKETFKQAKAEWIDYQARLSQYQKELDEWEKAQENPVPQTINRTFISFENMVQLIVGIANDWATGENS